MMLSIRNTLRSVSLLVATIAFAPGCDDGQVEALGLSVEDIDAMSEAELDELAALEDLSDPVRPGEPDPGHNPSDLREPGMSTHKRPGTLDEVRNPIRYTHVDGVDEIGNPSHRPDINTDGLDELRTPIRRTHAHKRPDSLPGVINPVHPTHGVQDEAVGELANEIDDGCDTHADDADLSNG